MTQFDEKLTYDIEAVTGGLANAGIQKHIFGKPGLGAAFCLIEKRMTRRKASKPEFDLCQKLCVLGKAGVHVSPMPNIIAAVETDDYYYIMMPFYEGVNVRLKDRVKHGRIIAKSVVKFNNSTVDVPKTNRMDLLIGSNSKAPQPTEEYAEYLKATLKICKSPIPEMFHYPPVKSHNDLFFANIATEVYGKKHNIVFIDFGHVSYNEVGADFHHFVRAAVRDLKRVEGNNVMIDEYARLTNIDKRIIQFNAHRFAMLRVAERSRSAFNSKRLERFDDELKFGWKLHATAQSLLAEMQDAAGAARV